MNKILLGILSLGVLIFVIGCQQTNDEGQVENSKPEYALVIHGGAGTILKKNMTPEVEQAYINSLDSALLIGQEILAHSGTALEAVEKVIMYLEDSPLFNAGRGAVFAHDGTNQMDASIMNGKDLNAGAVAGVSTIKHPIEAARAVMEQSEHVLLSGDGAENFASKCNLQMVDPKYFYTERRWNSLQRILDKETTELDHADQKHGTVGAVALDQQGNIVAGTSTGGMTNKRYNRIGDSPIIGAGTYANNATCGVSCTGHGEYFIRHAVAYSVSAQMEFADKSLNEAANYTVNDVLVKHGGSGGLVALDKDGNITMSFNTPGMYRGYITDAQKYIGIYKE